MKTYLQLSIHTDSIENQEIFIALLSEIGFNGFEQTDNYLLALGLNTPEVEQEADDLLQDYNVTYSKSIIQEENWNALWESNFQPVVVNQFAGIRAYFHEPNPEVKYDLVITPKMSFGTGHHATTWQMMHLMSDISMLNKRVFDFGTGTGILAILAEKMGAREVQAIDNDEWSIRNALENVEANQCNGIDILLSESLDGILPAEVVLANINKHILIEHVMPLSGLVMEGGDLLLSGLLEADQTDIIEAYEKNGLTLVKSIQRSGWVALHLKKKANVKLK